MKLLYLSCHSILEHDEIKLFNELGIDVFSFGTYHNPQKIDDPKRPTLDIPYHPELESLCADGDHLNMKQELIDWADVIVCMHMPEWLVRNWPKFVGKRVIYRAIGQSSIDTENQLRPLVRKGLEIVRYSPRESAIPAFAGQDALIRFYKDPAEYGPWVGSGGYILNITQDMKVRGRATNYQFWEDSTTGFNRVLIGKGSENEGSWGRGIVSYDDMKKYLNECGLYFYTGTYPASYVLNFMEALMTGCPIIALGEYMGNDTAYPEMKTYEIADFAKLSDGIIVVDDIPSARQAIERVLSDETIRKEMSRQNRELAIKLFGKEKIKAEWQKYLLETNGKRAEL